MVYIDGLQFQAVRWNQWKFLFTAKDAWLGPEMKLGGIPAIYDLQMDPGEQYDMVFNGAAPRILGIMATSPGRFSGSDNGWSLGYATTIVTYFSESLKKFPNVPTTPSGAAIGSDLPDFVLPGSGGPPTDTSSAARTKQ